MIGQRYKGPEGVYLCLSHDQYGFNMKDVNTGEVRSISERAIDRTFHRVRMSYGAWVFLVQWNKLGHMPPPDAYDAQIKEKLRDNGVLHNDGLTLTPLGVELLPRARDLTHIFSLDEVADLDLS